jgi:hypothetical protein
VLDTLADEVELFVASGKTVKNTVSTRRVRMSLLDDVIRKRLGHASVRTTLGVAATSYVLRRGVADGSERLFVLGRSSNDHGTSTLHDLYGRRREVSGQGP